MKGLRLGKKPWHGLKNGEQEVKCRAGGWKGFVAKKRRRAAGWECFLDEKMAGKNLNAEQLGGS